MMSNSEGVAEREPEDLVKMKRFGGGSRRVLERIDGAVCVLCRGSVCVVWCGRLLGVWCALGEGYGRPYLPKVLYLRRDRVLPYDLWSLN